MKIEPTMCLGELAERMGQIATREEAEYMREVLCETNPGEDTADIPDVVWKKAMQTALALKACDDLGRKTGLTVDDVMDHHLTRWLEQDYPHLDAAECLRRFHSRGFNRLEIYDAIDHGLTCADTLRRVLDLTGQTLDAFLMSAEGGAQ